MIRHLARIWYGRSPLALLLLPPAACFYALVCIRRFIYLCGLMPSRHPGVPVIVVGNLSMGGTGKTPVVAWLCDFLRARGWRPGIVSRGYGGRARNWPQQVRPDSDPAMVGDEPVLLARRTGCPMAVGPDRIAAARALVERDLCDILISDDGLQHYALRRDLELVVIDGVRRHGNGFCFPAGPLREPLSRLKQVDLLLNNGGVKKGEYTVRMRGDQAVNLLDPEQVRPLKQFAGERVHAVAAIGNPERFFTQLQGFGIRPTVHPFPDHHIFTSQDLAFSREEVVLMTEKDAVKCAPFAQAHHWCVPVDLAVDADLEERMERHLEALKLAADERR